MSKLESKMRTMKGLAILKLFITEIEIFKKMK